MHCLVPLVSLALDLAVAGELTAFSPALCCGRSGAGQQELSAWLCNFQGVPCAVQSRS